MEVRIDNVGKKFRKEIIFRNLSYTFKSHRSYALLGHNGSGKSTLLKTIAGYLTPNRGSLLYLSNDGQEIGRDDIYKSLVYVAPYVDVVEEFTIGELYDFHFKFKTPKADYDTLEKFVAFAALPFPKKFIKDYSSGMRQRLKLALAFATEADIVLLDEPTANLDQTYIDWYVDEVQKIKADVLLIVASNDFREYDFCDEQIDLLSYK